MTDKIFEKLKSLNKDMSDEEINKILNVKFYLCPGNYEFLPEEEKKRKLK